MTNYLVIGGAGTIGSAFVDKVLSESADNTVCVFSRSELNHHNLKSNLSHFKNRIGFYMGDIKDIDSVRKCVLATNPNVIIITAAVKRIEVCEENPVESLLVNSVGVDNVCCIAVESDSVGTVLFTSTDKASDPIGVYGNTKAIAEAIIRNYSKTFSHKRFISTRFANVLNSNGSVIPIFKNLIKNNKIFHFTASSLLYYVACN